MKILRSTIVVAGAVASLAMVGSPANAQGAGAFHGTASIDCFGCGVSSGSADLAVSGEVNGVAKVEAGAHAEYTVNEPVGPTCVVTGTASGTVSGSVNVDFNWTRVGAAAVITTSGDINGAGVAAFVVTSPVGLPCGVGVTATVAGAVAGA